MANPVNPSDSQGLQKNVELPSNKKIDYRKVDEVSVQIKQHGNKKSEETHSKIKIDRTQNQQNQTFIESQQVMLEKVKETLSSESTILSEEFAAYIPRIPTVSREITDANKREWLEKITDQEIRKEAKKALDGVRYVNFEEFRQGLSAVTEKLSDRIGDEPFIILYDSGVDDKGRGKSGIWTTILAYESLKNKPKRVEEWSYFDNPDLKPDPIYENIRRIVIFDDASYSGTQLQRAFEDLNSRGKELGRGKSNLQRHFPNAKITLVIPYITMEALHKVESVVDEVITLDQKLSPSPFSKELAEELNFKGSTATYFQHKVAAGGHSTVPLVEQGLVEQFDPPYKEGSL